MQEETREKIELIKECNSRYKWNMFECISTAILSVAFGVTGVVVGFSNLPTNMKLPIDALCIASTLICARYSKNAFGLAEYYSCKKLRLSK